MTHKAIFLDRDGVINKNNHYVNCIDDFEILPRVREALKLFKQAGYKIFVVTNQGGIEKGFLTEEDLQEIHYHMKQQLPEIDDIQYCPNYNSFYRKPFPGMIYELALDHEIILSESWMIGDLFTDIQAGLRAGCKTGMVVGNIQESIRAHGQAHVMADSLYEVCMFILQREGFLTEG
jgi:D-glycero-D-manno-heptose 1,7-bisphosphate phosphatase